MRRPIPILATVLVALPLCALPLAAADTPGHLVKAYDALADTILSVRQAEGALVGSILEAHYKAAERAVAHAEWADAAAQMALFANEGDNAVAGVRKHLLEGGHHFNAEGEKQGTFEPGYVLVDQQAKKAMLDATSAMRQAKTDDDRRAAWDTFAKVAGKILGMDMGMGMDKGMGME
jgi:hypothetical protein